MRCNRSTRPAASDARLTRRTSCCCPAVKVQTCCSLRRSVLAALAPSSVQHISPIRASGISRSSLCYEGFIYPGRIYCSPLRLWLCPSLLTGIFHPTYAHSHVKKGKYLHSDNHCIQPIGLGGAIQLHTRQRTRNGPPTPAYMMFYHGWPAN
jgi:hypothetical protein